MKEKKIDIGDHFILEDKTIITVVDKAVEVDKVKGDPDIWIIFKFNDLKESKAEVLEHFLEMVKSAQHVKGNK